MKVLFSLRNLWYVKHYEGVLRDLAARGHQVVVLTEPFEPEHADWREAADRLEHDGGGVRFEQVSGRDRDEWVGLARDLRWSFDYLRFLDPLYDRFPKLRERARLEVPPTLDALTRLPGLRTGRVLSRLIDPFERSLPPPAVLTEYLTRERPDVVVLSPLVAIGTTQLDVLRAARELGLRTVWAVGSWDHLSSKALVRDWPDHIFVWNERQRQEAVTLHGLPRERIVVTGAQAFDDWFDWHPRPREEFLRAAGLPADKPYVLYACSCLMANSPIEAEFVREWALALRRASSPRVRDVAILIRPHPKRDVEFDRVRFDDVADVVIWPRGGVGPVLRESKADYFDSLYHAEAVVGLNTSAFIEAGIVQRPVHALLLPQFHDNQEGTLHFHYLLNEAGGVLQSQRSLEEHVSALEKTMAAGRSQSREAFVSAFVRPHGLEVRATTVFVDGLEQVAAAPAPAPARRGLASAALRMLMRPAARRSWQQSPVILREHRRERLARKRADRRAAAAAAQAAEAERKTRARQEREAEKSERLRAHREAKTAARTRTR